MKNMFKTIAAVMAVCMMLLAVSCSSAPANTVFSVADMADKIVGVQLGTTGDIFASDYVNDEGVPAKEISRFNKGAEAIQALKTGKVDCVVIDEQPAKVFVEKNKDLTILEEEFAVEDYAIAIAKENTELLDGMNAAIATLKENGTLDQIIKNYIGEERGTCPYVSPEGVDRSKGQLVMTTNAAFEPYEYYENEKIVGIDAELAQAICDILGYELVIEDMEFDSIITAVQSGKADFGAAGMTVTEDRLENVNFTESYTTSKQVIIVRAK